MEFWDILIVICAFFVIYFILTSSLALLMANIPRISVHEIPDWGIFKEYRIPTKNDKELEAWVVYPEKLKQESDTQVLKDNPAIIFIHGWGRNRGRMISRARIYGNNGYTTILISTRDHGGSDKERLGMSIIRFSQDIDYCLKWWGKPVVLVGHSLGAGAALLNAGKNLELVTAVIAESSPFAFPYSLKYVYRPAFRWFTPILLPGITLFTLIKFWNYKKQDYSPLDIAPLIKCPILLIHGKNDKIFPHKYTPLLKEAIGPHCNIWIPDNTDHHNIEDHPDYEEKVMEFLKTKTG